MELEFTPLVRHRHLQTIWQTLFRAPPRVTARAESWETPDGDVLDLDLLPERAGAPGVIVLHGLEGSSSARYVRGILREAEARGWNGAALNFRSCGPSEHRNAPTYNSGFTRDVDFAASRLRERWKGKLGVVGFSLGGNVTMKWLGETGDASPVAAAVAISVPFDLAACARALDGAGGWAAIYRRRFLRTLKRKAIASAKRFPGVIDLRAVLAARTIRDFDDRATARLFGFASAEDYYARSSSAGFLARVRRPALLLSAADDPFIPVASIPEESIRANPFLTLRLLPHGGHVGFVGGRIFRPEYFADRIAIDFLASQLAS